MHLLAYPGRLQKEPQRRALRHRSAAHRQLRHRMPQRRSDRRLQVVFTFASPVTFSSATVSGCGNSQQHERQRNDGCYRQPHECQQCANDQGNAFRRERRQSTGDVSVPMGVLVGDTQRRRFCQHRRLAANAQSLRSSGRCGNFRSDVNPRWLHQQRRFAYRADALGNVPAVDVSRIQQPRAGSPFSLTASVKKWEWHDPQEKFTFIVCGVILVVVLVKFFFFLTDARVDATRSRPPASRRGVAGRNISYQSLIQVVRWGNRGSDDLRLLITSPIVIGSDECAVSIPQLQSRVGQSARPVAAKPCSWSGGPVMISDAPRCAPRHPGNAYRC